MLGVFSLSLNKLSIQISNMVLLSGILINMESISRLAIHKLGSCLQIWIALRSLRMFSKFV